MGWDRILSRLQPESMPARIQQARPSISLLIPDGLALEENPIDKK
jgi:hypothetical protein